MDPVYVHRAFSVSPQGVEERSPRKVAIINIETAYFIFFSKVCRSQMMYVTATGYNKFSNKGLRIKLLDQSEGCNICMTSILLIKSSRQNIEAS